MDSPAAPAAQAKIHLSRRQVKDADREGGIELMVLPPTPLHRRTDLVEDADMHASVAEHEQALAMFDQGALAGADLYVHDVLIAYVRRRYREMEGPKLHYAIQIRGSRWKNRPWPNHPAVRWYEIEATRPRGRPPNPSAPSSSERAAAWRQEHLAAGGRRIEIVLSPEAVAALAAIRTRDGDKSDTAVIERLLRDAR